MCHYPTDCRSRICGQIGLADDEYCWVRASTCVCMETMPPTPLPTSLPTPVPTPLPSYSPPEVVTLSVKDVSLPNSSSTLVDPTSKLTLESSWISYDSQTTFSWELICLHAKSCPALVRGDTTSTETTNEYLVLKPFVLEGGSFYTFRVRVANRYGAFSHGSINITANRSPWGGFLSVEPRNGTTMFTDFKFTAANWTDDPASLPLAYTFKYRLEAGGTANLRRTSEKNNISTVLPLGYSDYQLPVSMVVNDQIGSTTDRNATVRVVPPSLSNAVASVEDQTDNILDSIEGGDTDSAVLLIQASSEVLNYVFTDVEDDGNNTESPAERAAEVRSTLIEATLSVASSLSTPSAVESGLVCIESLSSSSDTLSEEDQMNTVALIATLANSSAGLGSVSSTAATSAVTSLSNVIGVGVLRNPNTTTDTTKTISKSLAALNKAITANLVAGEDPVVIVTPNLGLTNLVIDPWELQSGEFEVHVAPAEMVSDRYPASFALPEDLMDVVDVDDDGDGTAVVLATSWAENPYDSSESGSLEANSSVTSLTIGSTEVTGLSEEKPIIITLPLPGGARAVEGNLEVFVLNCSNQSTGIQYEFTSLEIARASFCGTEIGYREDVSWNALSRDPPHASFFCSDMSSSYDVACENASGAMSFECPFRVSGASCQFWDSSTGNWSSAGCTYWKSNYEEGWAKCNCTHLTDFAAQQEDLFDQQTSTFVDTATSAKDLTIQDIQKNMGILCVLGGIWVLCLLVYLHDRKQRKLAMASYLINVYRAQKLRETLEDLRALMLRADAQHRGNARRFKRLNEQLELEDLRDRNLSIIDRARSSKMATTLKLSREVDPKTFAEVKAGVLGEVVGQRKIVHNWWIAVKTDNELISCFYPGTWTSSAASRRGILMLARIITLLFICCLAAPEQYYCPPSEEGSHSHDEDIGLSSSFVEEYPDFVSIQKQDGTNAMLSSLFSFLWELSADVIYTTLWTLPAVALMGIDLWIGELLDNTDALQEERLMEQSHVAIVRPQAITSVRDGLVAESMLQTLEYIIERQCKVFQSKSFAKRIMADLQSSSGSPVDKSDLQRWRLQLRQDEIFVKRVRKQMRKRIRALQEQQKKSRAEELAQLKQAGMPWWRVRSTRSKILTERKKQDVAQSRERKRRCQWEPAKWKKRRKRKRGREMAQIDKERAQQNE